MILVLWAAFAIGVYWWTQRKPDGIQVTLTNSEVSLEAMAPPSAPGAVPTLSYKLSPNAQSYVDQYDKNIERQCVRLLDDPYAYQAAHAVLFVANQKRTPSIATHSFTAHALHILQASLPDHSKMHVLKLHWAMIRKTR